MLVVGVWVGGSRLRPCVRARTPSHARRMPLTVLPPSRAGRAHAPPRPRCWPPPRPALPAGPHGSQKACGCAARHHRRHRGCLSRRRRRAPPLPTRTATRATALRRACAHTARAAHANLRGCRGAEVQRSRGGRLSAEVQWCAEVQGCAAAAASGELSTGVRVLCREVVPSWRLEGQRARESAEGDRARKEESLLRVGVGGRVGRRLGVGVKG